MTIVGSRVARTPLDGQVYWVVLMALLKKPCPTCLCTIPKILILLGSRNENWRYRGRETHPSTIFPPRINIPPRRLPCIPIHTGPIHQPQRIGLHVPSRGRIIIPHPVLVQACLGLEPLPREPGGRRRPGRDSHPAERQISGGPDLDPRSIARFTQYQLKAFAFLEILEISRYPHPSLFFRQVRQQVHLSSYIPFGILCQFGQNHISHEVPIQRQIPSISVPKDHLRSLVHSLPIHGPPLTVTTPPASLTIAEMLFVTS